MRHNQCLQISVWTMRAMKLLLPFIKLTHFSNVDFKFQKVRLFLLESTASQHTLLTVIPAGYASSSSRAVLQLK